MELTTPYECNVNQRATAGWKAIKTAEILVDDYMVRIESKSTFASAAN